MWKFLIKNQSIEILEREILADHQISFVQFKFTFEGDWKRFHKVVQFTQGDDVYSIVLALRVQAAIFLRSFMWVLQKCQYSVMIQMRIQL